ncbi:hypothetical protein AB0H42_32065, partial [Nocardia sp. NPDC050799]|uniref:hypothetical protein n=1 Tax=Nocardia sp. NPDC050799 TaxID=3154842 RepID=UPI0033FD33EC
MPGVPVAHAGEGFAAQTGVGDTRDVGVVDKEGTVELGDIERVRYAVAFDDEDRTVPRVFRIQQAVDFTIQALLESSVGINELGETGGEAGDEC